MEHREGVETIVREIKRKTRRHYNSEVTNLRDENAQLKYLVAELSLRNRVLKKSLVGMEAGLED